MDNIDEILSQGYRKRVTADGSLNLNADALIIGGDDSPAQPYRMRLSNVDALVDKFDDYAFGQRRRPLEEHAVLRAADAGAAEVERRERKSSDVLLGDGGLENFKNSIIWIYSNDVITKRPVLTLKKKRDRSLYDISSNLLNIPERKDSYYTMKTRTGLTKKILFVENPIHKRFYEYYDSNMIPEIAPFYSKASQRRQNKHLCDFHVESINKTNSKSNILRGRKAKRFTHNSLYVPEGFLPTMTPTPDINSKPMNSNSIRRSPNHGLSNKADFFISPFKLKSKTNSSNTLEDKNVPFYQFFQNEATDDFPMDLEDPDTPGLSPCMNHLKRQLSADMVNRKRLITERVSMGHILLDNTGYRGSMDIDNHEMGISRVHSVVNNPSKKQFAFNNSINIRPVSRFQILEQTFKGDSRLSLLVIFNETTTLKIRMKKLMVGGSDDQNHPKLTLDVDNLQSDTMSDSNSDNNQNAIHNGKFKIVKMKSLMFAKDPIKNKLFAITLKYVEDNFWYDTLHKFLHLIDLIYSDLIEYYSRVLKDFSANFTTSKLEVTKNREFLVVDGQIKSAKLSCSTPIFGKDSFKVHSLGDVSYAYMPFTSNKKLPSKGPMSELSCSLIDSVTVFRFFVSAFA